MTNRTPKGVGGPGSSTSQAPQTRGSAVPRSSLATGAAKQPVANSPAANNNGSGHLFLADYEVKLVKSRRRVHGEIRKRDRNLILAMAEVLRFEHR